MKNKAEERLPDDEELSPSAPLFRLIFKVGDFLPVMVLFLAAAVVLSDQLIKIAVVQF